ncbi:SDR family NAD(P)-dependent oxidoreductase [Oricola thermophila]|nr:SDR family NAD(P)-dependent oxidoreductase [Oricola thermophila]
MSGSGAPPWKVAWITGASTGIGRELAMLLARRVETVAISARSTDKLEELASTDPRLHPVPLDVTDAQAVAECIGAIERDAGPIDLAVLNAGTWTLLDRADIDLAAMRAGIEVNYMGVVNALAALVPRMRERGSGHIVIVASVAGYRGLPRSAAYGPTKAALINLAETLKSELAPLGITVSLVNPGFIDTPMTRENPFPMPGLMPAPAAARALLDGLEKRQYEIIFPRGFVRAVKLLRILPNRVFFWYVSRFVMGRSKR